MNKKIDEERIEAVRESFKKSVAKKGLDIQKEKGSGKKMNTHIHMPKNHMDKLYNSQNFFVSWLHNSRIDQIIQLVPKEAQSLLDVGCGEGHLLERIENSKYNKHNDPTYYTMPNPKIKLTGIDVTKMATESAIKRCREETRIINSDILAHDFKGEKFDTIICTETIEHIKDYRAAIEKIKSLLSPNGTLIISFPNETNLTISRFFLNRKPAKVPDHVNSFNPVTMKKLVNLEIQQQRAIPRSLPFFASMVWIMVFKNKGE